MVTLHARLSDPRMLGASSAIERRNVVEMGWRICGFIAGESAGEYVVVDGGDEAIGAMLVAMVSTSVVR